MQTTKLLAVILSRQQNYLISKLHATWAVTPLSLCELRNLILLGLNSLGNFKFIDGSLITSLKGKQSIISIGGFYADYGKPSTVIFGNNLVQFWPDDWQRVVGGQKAVGHFVQWYQRKPIIIGGHKNSTPANLESEGNNLLVSGWLAGQVIGYERETDIYKIQMDRSTITVSGRHLDENHWDDYINNSTTKPDLVTLSVPLNQVMHLWADIRYKHKMGMSSQPTVGDERLSFSFADVGAFIKIWWSRYNKHYYGRIVSYDSARRNHSVVYEDSDTRTYDMNTRDYELIFPPPQVLKQLGSLSDAEAAKVVSSWHRKKHASVADRSRSESNPVQKTEAVFLRPNAAQSNGISAYQVEVINEFAKYGGLESLFQSFCDVGQAPPSCRVIMLNLQLIYQLKKFITLSRFQDLVWEAKEGIPCALVRYQETQLKELNVKDFNDVCLAIKDIILSVHSEDPATKQAPSREMLQAIEYIRLSIASKLLSCSQLQKRYLGLSMIKDVIEALSGRLTLLLEKRYQLLGAKKDSSKNRGNLASANANFGNAVKCPLSAIQMDSWIVENCVIKSVFGESLHQDLVARSDIILAYMAQRGILNEQHIDDIWSATRGAHEAVSRVLYLLILVLVPTLAPNLRLYLFNIISCTPIRDYSEQLLYFIKSYTIQTILAGKDEVSRDTRGSPSPARSSVQTQGSLTVTAEPTQRDKEQFGNASLAKRGSVVNAPSRQWLGFGVLWHFIQDNPGTSYSSSSGPNKFNLYSSHQQFPVNGGQPPRAQSTAQIAQDSDVIDENLIDLAIQLLVDLLQDEFKDERELVMLKCLDNIQAGISVPVSLQLLRKTLALHPTHSKSWFGGITGRQSFSRAITIQSQVEKLIKTHKLMEILFHDLEMYHRSMEEPSSQMVHEGFSFEAVPEFPEGTHYLDGGIAQSRSMHDLSSWNERKLSNGKMRRTSQLKGIVERLDFLKFVVSRSNIRLSESQTMLLWRALGEKASNVETLEKLCAWIDTLVVREDKQLVALLSSLSQENDISNPDEPSQLAILAPQAQDEAAETILSSAFEEGVLAKLFDDCILKWVNFIDKAEFLSRPAIARLCFKLFLFVNIQLKTIRVNTETGVWIRTGSLTGLPVLWRIAMDGSSSVALSAIVLLVELHHRTNARLKQSEIFKADFLRQCFKQLSIAIQSLQSDENVPPNSAISNSTDAMELSTASALANGKGKQTGDVPEWFEDGDYLPSPNDISRRVTRLVQAIRLFIHRFQFVPTKLITVTVLAGRNESAVINFSMKASDTVGSLREKIAHHFKDLPDSINLFKYSNRTSNAGNNTPPTLLDRDDYSLNRAKFSTAIEYVLVKRKETGGDKQKVIADGSKPRETVDLSLEPQGLLKPLDWLSAALYRHLDKYTENIREKLSYEMFVIPPLPWNSHIEISNNDAIGNQILQSSVPISAAVKKSENLARVHDINNVIAASSEFDQPARNSFSQQTSGDVLYNFLQSSPFYNYLLEILDGYLAANSTKMSASASSSQILPMSSADFDLSVAVWDVLQSLPSYSVIITQIKSINSGVQLSILFDALSPYRLLYTLQIVESFFSQAIAFCFEANNPKNSDVNDYLNWTVNFVEIGGADSLMQLINCIVSKIESSGPESDNLDLRPESTSTLIDYVMPRRDIYIALMSICSRIFHMLLLLDPAYKNWVMLSAKGATHSKLFSGPLFETSSYLEAVSEITQVPCAGRLRIPSGVVFSTVDAPYLMGILFSTLLKSYDLFRKRKIGDFALLAVAENIFILVNGLLCASENGFDILRSSSKQFNLIVYRLCIGCSVPIVRQGLCRRLFEACANIFSKCADPAVSQEEKKSRLKLFDFIYHIIVFAADQVTDVNDKGFRDSKVRIGYSNSEQIYCLIACVEALRSSPNLIFPDLSPKKRGFTQSFPSTASLDSFSIEEKGALVSEEDAMIVDSTILPMNAGSAIDEEWFKSNITVDNICKFFARKLMAHKSKESFHSTSPDGSLLGILRGLLILAHGDAVARRTIGKLRGKKLQQQNIITFLYVQCLFPEDGVRSSFSGGRNESITLAACQTRESREYAYILLYYLCATDLKNFAKLVRVLNRQLSLRGTSMHDLLHQPLHSVETKYSRLHDSQKYGSPRKRSFIQWNYDPSVLVKEGEAYVGLCNQGGTCYMNSFVQQLYHSLNFADGLLRIVVDCNDGVVADSAEIANRQQTEQENMIFQLQVMFGHLKLSQKRYYDTFPFCRSFIDYDGQPISLSEQKDINEFAGMLFDKMEHNKDCKRLLANTIQGKFVWKTRSTESSYRSEREENFYMITAEVKDKATLENALELNAAEEIFSGDNKIEDSNGQKVEATRRCEIRTLPNTLIIHLKRFEFDLETMNRKKVNDYISFPFELNMFPYTEEGIRAKEMKNRSLTVIENLSIANNLDSMVNSARPPSYYNYKLRGIVAHVGAIDRGHYYSFIKERNSQKWYEFNDRSVIPFNPDNIPNECFGGTEVVTNANGTQSNRIRENNAYLLIYEKDEPSYNLSATIPLNSSPTVSTDHINSKSSSQSTDLGLLESQPSFSKSTAAAAFHHFGDSDEDDNDYFIDNGKDSSNVVNELDETPFTPQKKEDSRNAEAQVDFTENGLIAKRVLEAVWTENTEFQKDRFLFDPIHFRFLWQLLKCPSVSEIIEGDLQDSAHLHEVLGQLCIVCLRFNVEVVARAFKAQNYFVLFFQAIEDVILKDTSKTCASFVIEELLSPRRRKSVETSDSPHRGELAANHSKERSNSSGSTRERDRDRDRDKHHTTLDSFHPWLVQVYLQYPSAATAEGVGNTGPTFPQLFTQLLMLCIRTLRPAVYVLEQQTSSGKASEPNESNASESTTANGKDASVIVSSFVGTILRLIETYRIEDIVLNDGFFFSSSDFFIC